MEERLVSRQTGADVTLRSRLSWWATRPGRVRALGEEPLEPGREQLLAGAGGDDRALLEAVDGHLHPDDLMYRGDPRHYLSVGLDAVRIAERCLGGRDPGSVLDYPCGFGRVLRFLRVRWPDAELTACDVQRRAVGFCARRYRAEPVVVPPAAAETRLEGSFDLIWSGSLLSHLPAAEAGDLLALFARSLAADGVAVVTTHGPAVAREPGEVVGELADSGAALIRDFEAVGFGHEPYPGQPSYGVAIASPAWVEDAAAAAGLELVLHLDRGWAGHQDVYALARAA